MLNLLIREKRYALRGEYFKRAGVVFLILMILVAAYYATLLVSNMVMINVEKGLVEKETAEISESSLKKDLTTYEEMLKEIGIEYKLFALSNLVPSKIISELIKNQISGISLNLIDIQNIDAGGNASVEIRGIASTRDVLIEYSNILKSNELFTNVDIPFSSLTKNTDIPFSLSVSVVGEEVKDTKKKKDEKK